MSRPFYTLTVDDVGKPTIRAFNRTWLVIGFIGRIMERDIGKRVYEVYPAGGGLSILQVENDEQLAERLGVSVLPAGESSRLAYTVMHERFPTQYDHPEINVCRQAVTATGNDDGVHWEFTVRWHPVGGDIAPRIEMFDDSWQAFLEVPQLFVALGENADTRVPPRPGDSLTVERLTTLLDRLGFVRRRR